MAKTKQVPKGLQWITLKPGEHLTKATLFEFLKDIKDDAVIGIAEPEGTDGYETPYFGVCAVHVCDLGCHIEIAVDHDKLYHD